jgi:hypothetical protein
MAGMPKMMANEIKMVEPEPNLQQVEAGRDEKVAM